MGGEGSMKASRLAREIFGNLDSEDEDPEHVREMAFFAPKINYNPAMRRRRKLKPEPVRKTKVSALSLRPSEPVALVIAFATATAVAGVLAVQYAGFGWSRSSQSANSAHEEGLQDLGRARRISDSSGSTAPVYATRVMREYAHDLNAFTQGLVWYDGYVYESTGLNGKSSVRRVELETGRVLHLRPLKETDFGEGLCVNGGKLVQLLWKTGKGYVYNLKTLEREGEFRFEGDGWGLASTPDGKDMFLSDGTSTIRVYRMQGHELVKVREFKVHDGTREVGLLNELEVIDGELWGNVWFSDVVARVDVSTGAVRSWVDLRGILKEGQIPKEHTVDVLNGIAYDKETGGIFVTGKLWPKLFSIEVTNRVVADDVAEVVNAFFLDPDRVRYVHENLLG